MNKIYTGDAMQKLYKLLCGILIVFISVSVVFGAYVLYEYIKYKNNAMKDITVVNMERDTEPDDKDFVDISKYIPDLKIELRYATTNNITKTVLYTDKTPYLRKGTADKLAKANEEFEKYGYTIKVWDAYRPYSVQYKLWEKVSDVRYIANPRTTGSGHNRGASVDITLVDKSGNQMNMPTDFDGFGPKSYSDSSDFTADEKRNVEFLEKVMEDNGFRSIETEWWHFDDTDFRNYPVVDSIKNNNVNRKYNVSISGNSIDYESLDGKENFETYFMNDLINVRYQSVKDKVKSEIQKVKQLVAIFNSNV